MYEILLGSVELIGSETVVSLLSFFSMRFRIKAQTLVKIRYIIASMKYTVVNWNVDPAIDLDWNIYSVIEMIINTEESLILTINSLPIAGKAFLIACGNTTENIVCAFDMPKLRAASVCPISTA